MIQSDLHSDMQGACEAPREREVSKTRELGTLMNGPKVTSAALVKFGYLLEHPCIPRYSFCNQTRETV